MNSGMFGNPLLTLSNFLNSPASKEENFQDVVSCWDKEIFQRWLCTFCFYSNWLQYLL